MKKFFLGGIVLFGTFILVLVWNLQKEPKQVQISEPKNGQSAIFANGCFWCVEHDLQEVPGVLDVVSGYSGGNTEAPTYKDYAQGGHREVVFVSYDPIVVTYANLVEHIIKHGDPTDPDGSFVDRGMEYAPAIYYENETEKAAAEAVIAKVNDAKVFEKKLTLLVLERQEFWPAEEYHQDYSQKNHLKYSYYRRASGRDLFIQKYWGNAANAFTFSQEDGYFWHSFVKPSEEELKQQLTPLQFEVTQREGTEAPFDNTYDKHFEEGIYVDIVSGEPLYSSQDKYDSGTGWPSFVKPISESFLVFKEDRSLFTKRIEVRSRFADSHLGHVFNDGPPDRGGKRYCMNSAALRFIPKDQMEQEGYGDLLESLNF